MVIIGLVFYALGRRTRMQTAQQGSAQVSPQE